MHTLETWMLLQPGRLVQPSNRTLIDPNLYDLTADSLPDFHPNLLYRCERNGGPRPKLPFPYNWFQVMLGRLRIGSCLRELLSGPDWY